MTSNDEQSFASLQPQELAEIIAPEVEPEAVPFALAVAKEVARIIDGAGTRAFDGHFVITADPEAGKGNKTAVVNGQIVPAGVGEIVSFSLAVSA